MEIREFLRTVGESLLPHRHKNLAQKPFSFAASYFFLVVIFGIILMCIALIPKIIFLQDNIDDRLAQLDRIGITLNVSAQGAVVLLEHPRVVLDLNKTMPTDEDVLITKEVIFYRPHPLLQRSAVNITDYEDLKAHEYQVKKTVFVVFMLLLPAFLLILFFVSIIKYVLLIIAATMLAWIVTRIRGSSMPFMSIMKIAIYSITTLVILDIVLFPYINWWLLAMLIYAVFFLFAVLITSEKSFASIRHSELFEKAEKKKKR